MPTTIPDLNVTVTNPTVIPTPLPVTITNPGGNAIPVPLPTISARQRWEYTFVDFRYGVDDPQPLFDKMGADGWEFIGTFAGKAANYTGLAWKRPG